VEDEAKQPVTININLKWPPGPLHIVIDQPNKAVRAAIKVTEEVPPVAQITVDDVNKKVTVTFDDDHLDTVSAPTGAVATFGSDNGAVCTVAADPADPISGDLTPVSAGDTNLSCAFNGTALKADGSTIADPPPVVLTVGPGPAASASLSVA